MVKLTHYGSGGSVRMVDVSKKPQTLRVARAHAFVRISASALRFIRRTANPKGNPLEIARIAGISGAKRTPELIPLCHPLLLTHIDVKARIRPKGIELRSEVTTTGPTGVEMEALAAVAIAALTIYDMCKSEDRRIEIAEVYLEEKSGGQRGHFVRTTKSGGGKPR
jgi:cyclic pyranopterin phosphate synthase